MIARMLSTWCSIAGNALATNQDESDHPPYNSASKIAATLALAQAMCLLVYSTAAAISLSVVKSFRSSIPEPS